MSHIEYNNLLFKISRRVEELNVQEQLLFMCRGRLASFADEGNNTQDVLSLFKELEEHNHLGTDHLEVMKDLLKGLEEWSLLDKVKKFESKRKEYIGLLEQIIRVLDELNDLERLISLCGVEIPEAHQGRIHNVQSLFNVLENQYCLGIDRLGIVKQILIELKQEDLLKEVEDFEKRRCEDEQFESRKAQAVAVVSSVRAASERIIGEVKVHCTFRKLSGALLVVGTGLILRRCSSLEEFVEAFREATLPAANVLRAISEGSVCFMVQAENRSALEALWECYRNGTLQASLQEFLVTEEIRQLADGEEVMVTVYIDEQEFRYALADLMNVEKQVLVCPVDQEEEQPMKLQRRNSDSNLYCKARDKEVPVKERPIEPKKPLISQAKYLNQERLAFVQNYLEKAEDARSMTTETSDSGMQGTHSTPSELGAVEETNHDSTYNLCLKDLSKEMVAELTDRLESDPISMERFCESFGLDLGKMHHPGVLRDIRELFPDTPVRLLKGVVEALQLYDLAELLEKAKTRSLRPAFPIKEIVKLSNASNRPPMLFSNAAVMILDSGTGAENETTEGIETFFKVFNSLSEVITVTTRPLVEISNYLSKIENGEQFMAQEEKRLRTKLEKQRKERCDRELHMLKKCKRYTRGKFEMAEQQLKVAIEDERALTEELEELIERREQWTKEQKPKTEKEIKQKKEELQMEEEKFQMAVSSVVDKWIQIEDKKSTLFAVFGISDVSSVGNINEMITTCLTANLALIPDDVKIVITPETWAQIGDISEALHVVFETESDVFLATMLEIFYKRWQALDLVSMMHEVQRTLHLKDLTRYDFPEERREYPMTIKDSLSSIPKLQKRENTCESIKPYY